MFLLYRWVVRILIGTESWCYFLKIKTLIITDIDYCKKLTSIDEIKDDDGITNAGLIQYYKDYVTVNIIKRDILPYCEHKCRKTIKRLPFMKKRKWKGYL